MCHDVYYRINLLLLVRSASRALAADSTLPLRLERLITVLAPAAGAREPLALSPLVLNCTAQPGAKTEPSPAGSARPRIGRTNGRNVRACTAGRICSTAPECRRQVAV
jgi:hypothetical protein